MDEKSIIIQADNISKFYSKKIVLDKINFPITKNDCVGIIGKNGAGKTTLLKILLGITNANSGNIFYKTSVIFSTEFKKEIGFYLGREFLPEELTGRQYLDFLSHVYQVTTRTHIQIEELFSFFFGNTDFIDKKISEYSYGMAQKIGVCGAIIHKPELLILDEPFNGLDMFSSNTLVTFLNNYKKRHTVIISSHDISFLEKICNKILILESGNIIYYGEIEKFKLKESDSLEKSVFNVLVDSSYKNKSLNWLI